MKTIFRAGMALMLCVCLWCMGSFAAAETQVISLPDGMHTLTLPEGMEYQPPSAEETDLWGTYLMPPDLEMMVFSHPVGAVSLQSIAEALSNAGRETEIREVAGTAFVVFQDTDDEDEAPCIEYGYLNQGSMVEISFFYGSQAAMDLTVYIMESFR